MGEVAEKLTVRRSLLLWMRGGPVYTVDQKVFSLGHRDSSHLAPKTITAKEGERSNFETAMRLSFRRIMSTNFWAQCKTSASCSTF